MSWLLTLGDELTNFLFIVVLSAVLYLAWLSTNTRDESIPNGAVVIMDRARAQLLSVHTGTNGLLVVRGPRPANSRTISTETEVEEIPMDDTHSGEQHSVEAQQPIHIAAPPSLESILDEVNDLAGLAPEPSIYEHAAASAEASANRERGQIIRAMDRVDSRASTPDGLRQRRPFVSERDYAEAGPSSRSQPPAAETAPVLGRSNSTDLAANLENCTNENSENGNVIDESAVAASFEAPALDAGAPQPAEGEAEPAAGVPKPTILGGEFRIKLKYLNDDLKLVKGSPDEYIGDFKKRNFTEELSNNKVVRLVFKGHVLQPDSKTLLACGLFDNCVVHCLVHNPRPNQQPENAVQGHTNDLAADLAGGGLGAGQPNMGERFEVHDRRLDTGILLLTLTLAFGLYVRFQHIQLFTAYPIYGYALVLALFAIIFGIVYMVDRGTRMMYTGALMLALTMSFSYYMRFQHSNLFTIYSTVGLMLLTVMLVVIVLVVYTIHTRPDLAAPRPNQEQQQPDAPVAAVDAM